MIKSIICSHNLRINEKDGSLLALIIPTMPDYIRNSLLDNLNTIFSGALHNTDTKAEGINNFFEALHLSWYNRYLTNVCFPFFFINHLTNSFYIREVKLLRTL